MLIRASLPFLPFSSLRPSASASLAHARAREPATTLYFRAKIPPAGSAPRRRPRGNCVQSELRARPVPLLSLSRASRFRSLFLSRRRVLSAFHPPVIYRGYAGLAVESVPADKGTSLEKYSHTGRSFARSLARLPVRPLAMLSSRFDHSRFSCRAAGGRAVLRGSSAAPRLTRQEKRERATADAMKRSRREMQRSAPLADPEWGTSYDFGSRM